MYPYLYIYWPGWPSSGQMYVYAESVIVVNVFNVCYACKNLVFLRFVVVLDGLERSEKLMSSEHHHLSIEVLDMAENPLQ